MRGSVDVTAPSPGDIRGRARYIFEPAAGLLARRIIPIISEAAPAMTRDPFDFGFLERFKIPLKRYDAGEKIFLEDDPGDHMYVVIEGKVNIVTYGSVLENVGMHGIFGEMALIDSAPRSAAAIAVEPTEVAIISKDRFLDLVRENPQFSLYVMHHLANRIRRMNKSL
jgi:CRP-like cAMP-binding protein